MPRIKTIAQLCAELAAKERQLAGLQARRTKLAQQLDQIDADIAVLAGGPPQTPASAAARPPARRRRRMPRNVKSLPEHIKDVLASAKGGMRVKDIMAAVLKAGYKTHSKDFYGQVAFAVQDKAFRKLGRGVYALKR